MRSCLMFQPLYDIYLSTEKFIKTILLVCLLMTPRLAYAQTFAGAVQYQTGVSPSAVVISDFNGDNKPDVAAANVNNSSVSILLGNGDGTFQAKVDYATGLLPFSLATGDFNGDTNPDLVVINYFNSAVSILLGNGNGTFQAKVDYATGGDPLSVTIGDFNKDTNLDLAVANSANDNSVSILLGNGNGTFQAKVDYAAGASPHSVTTGDFNGDTNPDLAVANYYGGSVSVLLGNGNGTFQAKVDYTTGNRPRSVTSEDFNGDTNPDIAVANYNGNSVSILLGNGNGTFQAKVDYPTGNIPLSVTTGDFNWDNKPDLAVANYSNNSVSILLGNGNGTFQAKVDYPTGTSPYSVATGDFNGDTKDDLVTADFGDNAVSIFINQALPPEPVDPTPFIAANTGCLVSEGGTLTFNDLYLKAGDADGPAYSITYNVTQAPSHGSLPETFTQNDIANGKIKYTHNDDEANEDTFKFTLTDTDGNTSDEYTFTITINGVNDPPIVDTLATITMYEDEEYILDLTSWYDKITDVDNPDSTLTIAVTCDNSNVTFTPTDGNKIKITSTENYFGNAVLNIIISDSELSCQTTVDLIIKSVNDLPHINGLPTSLSIVNGDVETIDLAGQADDVETPDNLLVWSFSCTPDSLNVIYDAEACSYRCSAIGSFDGEVELIIIVSDEDGGTDETTITVTVTPGPTGIEGLNEVPTEYSLFQNYPNPFNPSTVIRYSIPADVGNGLSPFRNVSLKIYDILGNEVATLVNQQQSPGYYERTWNLSDRQAGAGNVSSGIYFYILSVGQDFREVRKMILMK